MKESYEKILNLEDIPGEVFFFLLGVLFIFLKYEITGAIVATISVIFFLLNCFLCGNIKKTHDLHNVSSVERNENYIESTNNDLVMENIRFPLNAHMKNVLAVTKVCLHSLLIYPVLAPTMAKNWPSLNQSYRVTTLS
ncbi:uncharacterized protein LOC136076277 [Hydra vulgaris]|uniref:Uncharacterized protein LOC136076277 n=1 Tax=Hydra vulgaris TaxID=6087 RepID=A0ABM4BA90_HYDVU